MELAYHLGSCCGTEHVGSTITALASNEMPILWCGVPQEARKEIIM